MYFRVRKGVRRGPFRVRATPPSLTRNSEKKNEITNWGREFSVIDKKSAGKLLKIYMILYTCNLTLLSFAALLRNTCLASGC